jgi:hypothetical protein
VTFLPLLSFLLIIFFSLCQKNPYIACTMYHVLKVHV